MRIMNRINALPKDEQAIAQEALDIERKVAAQALNPNITWDNPDGPTAA